LLIFIIFQVKSDNKKEFFITFSYIKLIFKLTGIMHKSMVLRQLQKKGNEGRIWSF